jgi:hypothetical protein
LRPAETYFYLYAARKLIFVKMWPSNEFEFETPGLYRVRSSQPKKKGLGLSVLIIFQVTGTFGGIWDRQKRCVTSFSVYHRIYNLTNLS